MYDGLFSIGNMITLGVVLASILGGWYGMKLKIQRLVDVKADKKELLECIEKVAKDFNDTVKELKSDIGKAMTEMVGTYHDIDKRQIAFMAKTESENRTQEKNIEALWTKVNKFANDR